MPSPAHDRPTDSQLRIAIFGASGAAGAGVLAQCLADDRVAEVRTISRRPLPEAAPKLTQYFLTNFRDLEAASTAMRELDVCFYCLGISVSQVSDESEYREITQDYTIAAAQAIQTCSPSACFHFLSGEGANPQSRMMWARVKAETEADLTLLGLAGLVVYRPAYIHPYRVAPGRPMTDRIARTLYPLYRWSERFSIDATDLGKSMLLNALADKRSGLLGNREIRRAARQYGANALLR